MAFLFAVLHFLIFLESPSLSFAFTDRCSQYDLSVANTTDLQPVLTTFYEGTSEHFHLSYFQPLEGFEGISVGIEWLNKSATPIQMYKLGHAHCFNGSDAQRWWLVIVGCGYNKTTEHFGCGMIVGDCLWHCDKNYVSLLDKPWAFLHWVAHGPSRWRRDHPPVGCPMQDLLSRRSAFYEDKTCREPPHSPRQAAAAADPATDSHQPSSTLTVVVMVPLIVILLVLVIQYVVRRHRPTPAWSALPNS